LLVFCRVSSRVMLHHRICMQNSGNYITNDGTERERIPSHPTRVIFSGRSGCGKGVTAKNLLARASPPFDRIVIWHYATEI
jgi:hypothetical protein